MRIALFTRNLHVGGAQRQLSALARGLARRGHQVRVQTMFPGGGGWQELVDAGDVSLDALFSSAPASRAISLLQIATAGARLRARLRSWRPDILHSALYINNLIAWHASLGAPWQLVWGLRSSGAELNRSRQLALQVSVPLTRRVPLIISNSRAGLDIHRRLGYRARRQVAIANGIDTSCFYPAPDAGRAVRAEWGLAAGDTAIGIVARLVDLKDHPTFLRAGQLHLARDPGARLVVVGGGDPSYEEILHSLADELGIGEHVIWARTRDDMPAVYNALDLLVLCSVVEGFPNVVGEAMATGVPCVVTDVGDAAWIVGRDGAVVPPRSPERLADAIATMIRRRRDEPDLPARLRRRVEAEFAAASMITRTEHEFARLVGP